MNSVNYEAVSVNQILRSSKEKRTKKERLNRILFTAFLIVFFSILLVCLSFVTAHANELPDNSQKAFKYITVEKNDSLWSIAEEYMDDHYASISEYIMELKSINGIKADTIYAGSRLYIPCYIEINTVDTALNNSYAKSVMDTTEFDICNR